MSNLQKAHTRNRNECTRTEPSSSATYNTSYVFVKPLARTAQLQQKSGECVHLDHFFDEPSFFVEDVDSCRSHFSVYQQRHPHLRHRLKIPQNTERTANSCESFHSANRRSLCMEKRGFSRQSELYLAGIEGYTADNSHGV